jgi:xylulokinase
VLLPKDYVRLSMTGAKATDLSDASGTLWVDVTQRAWSGEMLAATGLTQDQMPRLHEGCEVTGALRQDVAAAWDMEPVVVAAGGGDNAAGAVGVGVIDDGDALLSLGTSGVLFVAGRAFRPNPERAVHAFCHALPGRWHQMSVMLSAASALDWAARLTGTQDTGALVAKAQARGRLDGREIFLPYLSGERTPHNDPAARGVLFGLDHDSDAGSIGQAVLEGVAFGLADGSTH